MAQKDVYNTIIVSVEPRGRFFDGYVEGALRPGTICQIKAATEPIGGRHTWQVYDRAADGDRPAGPIVILLEQNIIGRGITDAYASGSMGHFYVPLPGDELLAILGDVSGTGDAHTIGEVLMVDDGTGELVVTTGTPQSAPFMCLETLAAPTADTHAHVMFSGH
jgi:hypothetical protein